jgi:hypothetical protein
MGCDLFAATGLTVSKMFSIRHGFHQLTRGRNSLAIYDEKAITNPKGGFYDTKRNYVERI